MSSLSWGDLWKGLGVCLVWALLTVGIAASRVRWDSTEGTVLSSRVQTATAVTKMEGRETGRSSHDYLLVVYGYRVAGRSYESDRFAVTSAPGPTLGTPRDADPDPDPEEEQKS